MGLIEWIKSFSLPKTEDECNDLRTADTDAKPVQWDAVAGKCSFFVPTDEARLGMSKCTAGQMFDMSNNTCSEKVVDTACGAGMYRASEGGECVAAPSGTFDQSTLLDMGECGARLVQNGTSSWVDGACSLSCNEDFSLNGEVCEANCPDGQEKDDQGVCQDIQTFTNRGEFSDRDVMILVIIVGLMYMYRKELVKQFKK